VIRTRQRSVLSVLIVGREIGVPAGKDWLVLIALLALCFAVAGIGGFVTATSVESWYPTLAKPGFTPPDWVFGPVWGALYAMMALAAWLVGRRVGWRDRVLGLFFAQLALNLAWSVLFFGLQLIGAALAEILLLLALLAATTLAFWRIDRRAGLLFVPYLLWVGYASLLNAAIWLMN
jgi:tryptophan-rich sensory protein